MCGFTIHIFESELTDDVIQKCKNDASKISHRGPDESSVTIISEINCIIVFHRLAINGGLDGMQPFFREDNSSKYYLICNGEIYNHEYLENKIGISSISGSDCEVIINGMIENFEFYDPTIFNSEHALVAIKVEPDGSYALVASNDRFGKRPLFQSKFNGGCGFSSELQGLSKFPGFNCNRFKSSTSLYIKGNYQKLYNYYNITDIKVSEISFQDAVTQTKHEFKKALRLRLESCGRKIGFALSGGIDSTANVIFAVEIALEKGLTPSTIETFSIGLPGSDDEIYARKVAEELGTTHTHFTMTKERYLQLIDDVITCVGSFDTTTIRASIGQYELSRLMREMGIIVVISGDGADELFGSYDDPGRLPGL